MRSFFRLAWKLSRTALMLLCQGRLLVDVVEVGGEQGKEAAGDVAHEATPDLLGALALGGAAGGGGAGPGGGGSSGGWAHPKGGGCFAGAPPGVAGGGAPS